MPAIDPHVLAVGAVDHDGTAHAADDAVADFTNGGNDAARRRARAGQVGRLAPGPRLLRRPTHPEGRVPATPTERFFRGSGTSQATAVVAGEAALLFAGEPEPHARPGQGRC